MGSSLGLGSGLSWYVPQMQLWASLLAGMCRWGSWWGKKRPSASAPCQVLDGAVCCADRLDHELKTSVGERRVPRSAASTTLLIGPRSGASSADD